MNVISREVGNYSELLEDIDLDDRGFATDEMIAAGMDLFPDAPGQPEGSGYDDACALIRDAINGWLRTCTPRPFDQIRLPPSTD